MRGEQPTNGNKGLGGLLWVFDVVVPIAVGAGLIRPRLNTLMTRRVTGPEYGRVLGLSASVVSAANAAAPLLGGLIFQSFGASAPFLIGGVVMGVLFIGSVLLLREG